jgi:Tol biopolymer transport system component
MQENRASQSDLTGLHSPSQPRRTKIIGRVLGVLVLLAVIPSPANAYPRPGATELISDASGLPSPISDDGRYVVFLRDNNVFVRDRVTGAIERVGVASDGRVANAECNSPVISADGRYVAFWSIASNLVSGDTNGTSDVFVHDRVTGATERVSVASDGSQASACFGPAISGNGRYVAFWSDFPNLVPGDTNGSWDVFVHDRVTGVTERASVASDGTQANSFSFGTGISADGRYVGFIGAASNLVPGDTNGSWDTFVHDRVTGVTERVSVASDGTQGNNNSYSPAFSADGRYVAFESGASNLVPGATRAGDIFVRDRATGATERVSVGSNGTQANGFSSGPAISADGRYVGFHSEASNLVPGDTNGATDAFVHDRIAGITERVSVASDGAQANSSSYAPSISADGRSVAFLSYAHLVPGDKNGVFVRDRGGSVGVLDTLSVQAGPEGVAVSGQATFSGAVISSVDDPTGDAPGLLGPTPDTDLTGASLTYRPEQGDLLVRLRGVTAAPGTVHCTVNSNFVTVCEQGGGAPEALSPGVPFRRTLYGIGFERDGISFEIRARAESTFVITAWVSDLGIYETRTFVDPPYLALYRCDPVCTEQTLLEGARGTTGVEFWASVPLSALGASEGAALSAIRAFTAREETDLQARETIDGADLPDAAIAIHSVSLGVAPAGTPESQVVFNTPTALTDGNFLGTVALADDYSVWARACLGVICGPAVSWPPRVQLNAVVSTKIHGTAGAFDVDLPLSGNPGLECRSGGANGDYTLVFTFANPLMGVDSVNVSSGTVSSRAIGSDPHQYIVNLSGVTNAQTITISLTNVGDSVGNFSNAISVSMGVLVGDVNASRVVTSGDTNLCKAQALQTVTTANFRNDINASGSITTGDVNLIKQNALSQLPP